MWRLTQVSLLCFALCMTSAYCENAGAAGRFSTLDFAKSQATPTPNPKYLCRDFQPRKELSVHSLSGTQGSRVSIFSTNSAGWDSCSAAQSSEDVNMVELIATAEMSNSVPTESEDEVMLDESVTLLPWKVYTLCQSKTEDNTGKLIVSTDSVLSLDLHPVLDWVSSSSRVINSDVSPETVVREGLSASEVGSMYGIPGVGFGFESVTLSMPEVDPTVVVLVPHLLGTLKNGGGGDVVTFFEFSDTENFDVVQFTCSVKEARQVGIPSVFQDIGINHVGNWNNCGGTSSYSPRYVRFAALNEHGKATSDVFPLPVQNGGTSLFRLSDYGTGLLTLDIAENEAFGYCSKFRPEVDISVTQLMGSGLDIELAIYVQNETDGGFSDIVASAGLAGYSFETVVNTREGTVPLYSHNNYWICQFSAKRHYGIQEFAEGMGSSELANTPVIGSWEPNGLQSEEVATSDPNDVHGRTTITKEFIPRIGFAYDSGHSLPKLDSLSLALASSSSDADLQLSFGTYLRVQSVVFEWIHNGKHRKQFKESSVNVSHEFSLDRDLPIYARGLVFNLAGVAATRFEKGFRDGHPYRAESFSTDGSPTTLKVASDRSVDTRGFFFEPGEDIEVEGFLASSDDSNIESITLHRATLHEDGSVEITDGGINATQSGRVFFRRPVTLQRGQGYVLAQTMNGGGHVVSSNSIPQLALSFFNLKMHQWGSGGPIELSGGLLAKGDILNPSPDGDYPNIGLILSTTFDNDAIQGSFLANYAPVETEEADNSFLERGYAFSVRDYVSVEGMAGGATGTFGSPNFQGRLYKCSVVGEGKGIEIDSKLQEVTFSGNVRRQIQSFGEQVLEPDQCYFLSQGTSDQLSSIQKNHFRLSKIDGQRLENETVMFFNQFTEFNHYHFSWRKDQETDQFTSKDFQVLPDIGLVVKPLEIEHITTIQEERESAPEKWKFMAFIQNKGIMRTDAYFQYGDGDNLRYASSSLAKYPESAGSLYETNVDSLSIKNVNYRIVLQPKFGSTVFGERRSLMYIEPLFPGDPLNGIPSDLARAGIRDHRNSKSSVKFILSKIADSDARHDTDESLSSGKEVFISNSLSDSRITDFSVKVEARNQRCIDGTKFDFSRTFESSKFADFKVANVQSKISVEGGILQAILFVSSTKVNLDDLGVRVLGNYDSNQQAMAYLRPEGSGGGASTKSSVDAFEPNNYFDTASPLYLLAERIRLSFHATHDVDFFTLRVDQKQTLRIQVDHQDDLPIKVTVFNGRRVKLEGGEEVLNDAPDKLEVDIDPVDTAAYFVKVEMQNVNDSPGLYDLFMDVVDPVSPPPGPGPDRRALEDASATTLENIDRPVAAYGPFVAVVDDTSFSDTVTYGFEIHRINSEFSSSIAADGVKELWRVETRLLEPSTDHPRGVSFQDDDRYQISFTAYPNGNCEVTGAGDSRKEIFDVKRLRPKEFMMREVLDTNYHSYRIVVSTDGEKAVHGECLPRISAIATNKGYFTDANTATLRAKIEGEAFNNFGNLENSSLKIRLLYGSSPNSLTEEVNPQVSMAVSSLSIDYDITTASRPLYYKLLVSNGDTKLAPTDLDPAEEYSSEVDQAIDVLRTELSTVRGGNVRLRGVVTHANSEDVFFRWTSCSGLPPRRSLNVRDAKISAVALGDGRYLSNGAVEVENDCYVISVNVGDHLYFESDPLPILRSVSTTTVSVDDEEEDQVTLKAVVDSGGHDDMLSGYVVFKYGTAASNLNNEIPAVPEGNGNFTAKLDAPSHDLFYEVVVQNPDKKFPSVSPQPQPVRGGVRRLITGVETAITSFDSSMSARLRGVVSGRMKNASRVSFRYGSHPDNLDEEISATLADAVAGIYISENTVGSANPIYYSIEVEAQQNTLPYQTRVFKGAVLPVLDIRTFASRFNATGNEILKGKVMHSDEIPELDVYFEVSSTSSFNDVITSPLLEGQRNGEYQANLDTGAGRWYRIVARQNTNFLEYGPGMELVDLRTLITLDDGANSKTLLRGLISNPNVGQMDKYTLRFSVKEGSEAVTSQERVIPEEIVEHLVEKEYTREDSSAVVYYRLELRGESDFDTLEGEMLSELDVSAPTSIVQRNGDLELLLSILNQNTDYRIRPFIELLDCSMNVLDIQFLDSRNEGRYGSTFSLNSPARPLSFRLVLEDLVSNKNMTSKAWEVLAVESIARISRIKLSDDKINAMVTLKGTVKSNLVEEASVAFMYGAERNRMEASMGVSQTEKSGSFAEVEAYLQHQVNEGLVYRLKLTKTMKDGITVVGLGNVWPVIGDFEPEDELVLPDDFEDNFGSRCTV